MANEVYQPQELETTVPEMSELTAEELSQQDRKGLETLLYIIRGLGIDRDRFMTIAEFVKAIGQLFQSLKIYDDVNKKTVSIENGGISAFNNIDRLHFNLSWQGLNIVGEGFTFEANGNRFSYNGGNGVSFAKYGTDGYEFEITKDGLQLKIDNGEVKFNVSKTAASFEKGDYRTEMSNDGITVYCKNSVVYKSVGGIINVAYNDEVYLDQIQEVLNVGHVPGAVIRLYVSPNAKIYKHFGQADYLKVGNEFCVVEFVNFDYIGEYSESSSHYFNPTAPNWNWQVDK